MGDWRSKFRVMACRRRRVASSPATRAASAGVWASYVRLFVVVGGQRSISFLARKNTRRSSASATLEESGRKSKREAREAKASGIHPKFNTKCWESQANASLSAVEKH